jgi:hypothetical protein
MLKPGSGEILQYILYEILQYRNKPQFPLSHQLIFFPLYWWPCMFNPFSHGVFCVSRLTAVGHMRHPFKADLGKK